MNTILTDDEIADTFKNLLGYFMAPTFDDRKFARATEAAVLAKLREQEPAKEVRLQALDALNRMQSIADMPDGRHPREVLRTFIQLSRIYAAPQPAVVQVPKMSAEDAFDKYLELNPQGRQRKGKAIGYKEDEWLAFQEVWNKFHAPQSPAQADDLLNESVAEGFESVADYVTYLKKSKDTYFAERNSARDAARRNREAQTIPPEWREAVKRLRKNEAAGDTVFRCGFNAGLDAALAQLDSLEGGE